MPSSPIQPAQQTAAKVAGIAYLITFAIVVYVNFGIYERLIVEHDATETARNILTHERLFRIGIAGDLIYCAGVIVLLTALYVILKPVSQDLGLRYSEFECLPTTRCNFTPDKRHPLGYVQIRRGENPLKSHWSHRDIPLTRRTRAILEKACRDSRDDMVFHVSKSTLEHQLRRFRKQLKLPQDFVLHSFRHTFGTRLGEDGATVPQIRQLMGHQSMATSQKYVHQLNEGIAELVQRMDARNQAALKKTMFKVVGL